MESLTHVAIMYTNDVTLTLQNLIENLENNYFANFGSTPAQLKKHHLQGLRTKICSRPK